MSCNVATYLCIYWFSVLQSAGPLQNLEHLSMFSAFSGLYWAWSEMQGFQGSNAF